jgi:hypothetical protein
MSMKKKKKKLFPGKNKVLGEKMSLTASLPTTNLYGLGGDNIGLRGQEVLPKVLSHVLSSNGT